MLSKINDLRTQKGSLMIEALAMLGLISMVTPVIYKKAAERTTEMQDINAASQVRVIVKAIDDYLRDNYTTITSGGEVKSNTSNIKVDYGSFGFGAADSDTAAKSSTPIKIEHFRDYLPLGFQPDGKLFKEFDVVIKQTRDPSGERKALTTVLVAKTSKDGKVDPSFTRLRSSRIASMIGTNGGYVDGDKATGVQGVWEIPKAELPDSKVENGTIVATSIEAVADGTAGGKNVLHRVSTPGRPEYNTMETALNMGSNDVTNLVNLIAAGNKNTINIKAGAGSNNAILHVDGQGLIDSTLKAASENFIAESGYMQHRQGLYVGASHSPDEAMFYVDGSADGKGSVRAASGNFTVSSDGDTTMAGFADIGDYAKIANYISAVGGKFGAGMSGGTPTLGLKDEGGSNVLLASKNNFQLMGGKVYVDSDANTKIDGTLSGLGDLHIGDDIAAADGAYTSGGKFSVAADSGNTYVGGKLTVGGGAAIDGNFQAGKMTNGNYGLNVDAGSGNTTLESNLAVRINGNRIFDVNATTSGFATANQFHAGEVIADKKYGLIANSEGATVRFKGDNSSFEVKDSSDRDQIKATNGKTVFSTNGNKLLELYTQGTGAAAYPQATFTSDVAVSDGTNNVLTVSQNDADGLLIGGGKGAIHVRKGIIEIATNTDATTPRGYIQADRLVSNVLEDKVADGTSYKLSTTNENTYAQYQVNPAYTSMMHDIKLATRGGARLSDILPDFINKGIYVMDNTYYVEPGKSGDWTNAKFKQNSFELDGMVDCKDNTRCDTSPWMGFIPAPNCPPGYMKVATITPIRFSMAQAGIPMDNYAKDITGVSKTDEQLKNYRQLGVYTDPRGNVEVNTGDGYKRDGRQIVSIEENTSNHSYRDDDGTYTPTYWGEITHNRPYTFQINTWLNTTIKAYYSSADETSFKGWHGIMGFIYPAESYIDYAASIGIPTDNVTGNTIFWNLFPVFKEELSAIATVYCYFNRTTFSTTYVDQYLAHRQGSVDNIRNTDKGYLEEKYKNHLNDPTLKYDSLW